MTVYIKVKILIQNKHSHNKFSKIPLKKQKITLRKEKWTLTNTRKPANVTNTTLVTFQSLIKEGMKVDVPYCPQLMLIIIKNN